MAMTFELVSPERLLTSVEADAVTIPGVEGDFTAMPGHAPFLTTLRPGYLTVQGSGGQGGSGESRWFVTGGFAEISNDVVSVLADRGIEAEKLDTTYLDERIAEAEKALEEAPEDRRLSAIHRLNTYQALRGRL